MLCHHVNVFQTFFIALQLSLTSLLLLVRFILTYFIWGFSMALFSWFLSQYMWCFFVGRLLLCGLRIKSAILLGVFMWFKEFITYKWNIVSPLLPFWNHLYLLLWTFLAPLWMYPINLAMLCIHFYWCQVSLFCLSFSSDLTQW